MFRTATDTVMLNRDDILKRLGFNAPDDADVYVSLATEESTEFHPIEDCLLVIRVVGESVTPALAAA